MSDERLLKILVTPHISEKSASVSGLYVFEVMPDATKPEIKKAVEQQFNVAVKSVRVCRVKGKTTRFKQVRGRRRGWKKAFVTLVAGNQIDIAAGD